jgi:hypothetical protein
MRAPRSVPAILGAILAIAGVVMALRWMKTARRPTIEPVAGAERGERPAGETPTSAPPSAPATADARPEPPSAAAADPAPAPAPEPERGVDSGQSTGFLLVKREDGTPISDAMVGAPGEVALEGRSEDPAWRLDELDPLASSDPAGLVRLDAAQPEAVLVVAASGFGAALVDRAWLRSDAERPLEVELAPSATLQASVRTSGGAPVEGVLVRAFTVATATVRSEAPASQRLEGRIAVVQRTTDREGRATLELPSRVAFRIEGWHAGVMRILERQPFELEPGTTTERTFEITAGLPVRGRVLDEKDEPVPDAKLDVFVAVDDATFQGLLTSSVTDAQGRFEIALAPGRYFLRLEPVASTLPRDGFLLSGKGVVVAEGVAPPPVEIAVRRGFTVRGRVLDPDGEPAQAEVEVTRVGVGVMSFLGTTSDSRGRFVLGPFEDEESYELVATASDGARSDAVVADTRRREPLLRMRR